MANSRGNRATEDIIEAQNREYHDRLSNKSSYLKSLAFDIENEARDHHKLLGSLDDEFDGTSGFLGGTMNRVKHMMGSGRNNRQLMCYVTIGIVLMLFMFYFIIGKLFSSSKTMDP